MLTHQKTQSPTPPVHMLYEGFDNIGKDLIAFEETMGKITDNVWEQSAKHFGDLRDDEFENEDWIKINAPRVPDPVLSVDIIERGFSTLHKTFDVFESFMKKRQRRFEFEEEEEKEEEEEEEEGEIVSPAKLAHAQAKSPNTVRARGNVALEDQEPTGDNSSHLESHSRERVADGIAKSLKGQGDQIHTVRKPLKGDMSTRHNTAKEKIPMKGERGNMETSAPAQLANTKDRQPMLTPKSSRKHAPSSQDSDQKEILPPTKRRALFDQELHSPRAAPVPPYRKTASPRTPVRAQGLENPRRESSDYYRPSDSPRIARSDTERDRCLSVASQGKLQPPGRDSTQRPPGLPPRPPGLPPRPPSGCRSFSFQHEYLG